MKRILIVCLLLFSMGVANADMIPRPGNYTDVNYKDYKARHNFYETAAYSYFNYSMGNFKTNPPGQEAYTASKLMEEMESYLTLEKPDDEAHAFVAKTYLMTRHYLLKKQERQSIDWQWSFMQEDLKSYEIDMDVYYKSIAKMKQSYKFAVYVPLEQIGWQILRKGNTKEQRDYKLIDVFIFNALQYIKYNNDEGENSTLARQIMGCTKCFPNKKSIYTYEKVINELRLVDNKFNIHIFSLLYPQDWNERWSKEHPNQ